MLIAVVGDCLLDVSVRPSGPMRPGADAPAAIRLSPGGQGANVAVRLARRGAPVRLITGLADDAAGRFLREAVEAEGVELVAMPVVASGSVVALLDEDAERTMLSDRAPFVIDRLPDLITDAGWIHVSGYALRDAGGASLAAAIAALPDEMRISVGGGSVTGGAEASRFAELLGVIRPDILILNADEREALDGRGVAGVTITTAGIGGSTASGAGFDSLHVPAPRLDAPVVDTTGAGDAYAAAVIGALAKLRRWPAPVAELRAAMEDASRLGAEVARTAGAQGRVDSAPASG